MNVNLPVTKLKYMKSKRLGKQNKRKKKTTDTDISDILTINLNVRHIMIQPQQYRTGDIKCIEGIGYIREILDDTNLLKKGDYDKGMIFKLCKGV